MEVDNPTSVIIDVCVMLSAGFIIVRADKWSSKTLFSRLFNYVYSGKYISESGKAVTPSESDLSSIEYGFKSHEWGFCWHFMNATWCACVIMTSDYIDETFNPYFVSTSDFWIYSNATTKNSGIPLGLRILYLLQIGYYIVDSIDFAFFAQAHAYQGSKAIILTHHISALLLLLMVYLPPYSYKIGVSILLMNELPDATIHLCLLLHYASKINYKFYENYRCISIIMTLHLILWIVFRVILLPRFVFSVIFEMPTRYWQKWPGAIFLSILSLIHIYWAILMCIVFYKKILKNDYDVELIRMVSRMASMGSIQRASTDLDTNKKTNPNNNKNDENQENVEDIPKEIEIIDHVNIQNKLSSIEFHVYKSISILE